MRLALARGAEAIFSVALVLVFFLAILGLLSVSFPAGTGLTDLIGHEETEGLGTGRSSLVFDVYDGRRGNQGRFGNPFIAVLSSVHRTVKDKPADAIAWTEASSGTPLGNRHAIQTFSRASATISFSEPSKLRLGPNSLVVIRNLEEDPRLNKKRASLLVLDGELRGHVAVSGQDAMQVEVETASASSRIGSQKQSKGDVDFKVAVNPDKSSTFSVYEGAAEVSAHGETVLVEENQSVTVVPSQPPAAPRTLPAVPELTSPPDGTVYYYRSQPPRIRFNWTAEGGPEAYRFVLARDPASNDIVHEARLSKAEFTHGNLRQGSYFWRVSSLEGDAEGGASQMGRFQLVEDREPPALEVDFPQGAVTAERLVLKGTTEPGARVFIDSNRVDVSESGNFEYAVKLQRGVNVVIVEAVDLAGNTAYESRLVKAKY